MENRQGDMLTSLRGVQDFIHNHADRLGAVPACGARRKLDAEIERLNAHASAQVAGNLMSQGATQKLYALRRVLMEDHMAPIARIALAELSSAPELDAFRMPSGKLTVEELAAAGNGMAAAAEPFAEIFVACGMAPDFANQLRAAGRAMCDAVDARKQDLGMRRGATVGIAESIRNARRLVHVLDAFVRREIRNDPALLTAWETVQRVPARKGRASAAGVTVEVVVAIQPAAGLFLDLPAPEPVRLLQLPRVLLKAG